jgi:hypothetical protein
MVCLCRSANVPKGMLAFSFFYGNEAHLYLLIFFAIGWRKPIFATIERNETGCPRQQWQK